MPLSSPVTFANKSIVKNPNVAQIMVDQELIILEETHRTYFSLNVIGAKMWSLFNAGAQTLADLAKYLRQEYHLQEQQSINDAQQFVELLLANDLLIMLAESKEELKKTSSATYEG